MGWRWKYLRRRRNANLKSPHLSSGHLFSPVAQPTGSFHEPLGSPTLRELSGTQPSLRGEIAQLGGVTATYGSLTSRVALSPPARYDLSSITWTPVVRSVGSDGSTERVVRSAVGKDSPTHCASFADCRRF